MNTLAEITKIAIVKVGSKGSMIKENEKIAHVGVEATKVVDTTGAGDLYAAGFLYGYVNNLSNKKSGQIGAILASKVIADYGAKISDADWKEIRNRI